MEQPKTVAEKITFYKDLAQRQAQEIILMNERASAIASRLVPMLGEYQAAEAQRVAAITSLIGLQQIIKDLSEVPIPESPKEPGATET